VQNKKVNVSHCMQSYMKVLLANSSIHSKKTMQ